MAKDTVREIREQTKIKNIELLLCDVADSQEIENVWRLIVTKHGKVDVLINNAARTLGKRISEVTYKEYKQTMKINFLSIV